MRHGCEQVVFLDATEHRHFEELGGMNVFFVLGDTLVTPPLTDTILPGITRDSVITLARHRGLTVQERLYSIDEFRSDAASGALTEMFGCGTAAVITPIARLLCRAVSAATPAASSVTSMSSPTAANSSAGLRRVRQTAVCSPRHRRQARSAWRPGRVDHDHWAGHVRASAGPLWSRRGGSDR
jgi:hypothetical protein